MTKKEDINYIVECAESVGTKVDDRTAISIYFIASVMRKMREQSIIIPYNATNGDVIKTMFPDAEIFEREDYHCALMNPCCDLECGDDWWNSPYRKEHDD